MTENAATHIFRAEGGFCSVEQARKFANLGRTKFYELVRAGHFRTIRIGDRRLIDVASFKSWLASLSA